MVLLAGLIVQEELMDALANNAEVKAFAANSDAMRYVPGTDWECKFKV